MKKYLFLIAALAMTVTTQMWAEGVSQTVCQSSAFVYANDLPSGYSAEWDLSKAGTPGTDYALTGDLTDDQIQVGWKTATPSDVTRLMKTRDISSDGCIGPWKEIHVTVKPKPDVEIAPATLCSENQGGTTYPDKYNTDLPTTDKNGENITKWVISVSTSLDITRHGADLPVEGTTDASIIKDDYFTNSSTTESGTATYTYTPYIGECPGDTKNFTITVLPRVPEPTVTFSSI